MIDTSRPTERIEDAFARAEAEAAAALAAAALVTKAVKGYLGAARQGKVRELRQAAEAARGANARLAEAVERLAGSWSFDEEAYLQSGAFAAELLERARAEGLMIAELDGRLYSYPALLRVTPAERAVQIDKARERRIRPSVLVAHLRDLQQKPPRFKAADFLASLAAAYRVAVERRAGRVPGSVVPLTELYELLTLLPGQAREYSRQEFARDIYLLDQSGQTTTKEGARLEFHAGAGATLPRGTLSVVTQSGEERKYHGVAFVP